MKGVFCSAGKIHFLIPCNGDIARENSAIRWHVSHVHPSVCTLYHNKSTVREYYENVHIYLREIS